MNTIERDGTVGIHETVVTDFHKAGGQHVLKESADEFQDFESQDPWTFTVGLAITNEHGAVVDINDPGIGDGDFEDVGGEILEASSARRYRLAVDVPVDVPDFGGDLIEQLGFFI